MKHLITLLIVITSSIAYCIEGDSTETNNLQSLIAADFGDAEVMMDYSSVHVPSQDKSYYEAMVWNTETGESVLYFYSYDSKSFKKYEDNVQLPKSYPGLGSGEIMIDYTSVHVPSQDKTYYEALVWNTKTGKSELYYYKYSDKKFVKYGDNVQLDLPKFSTSTGKVMMRYTSLHVPSEDKTYYEALMWNTKTGESELHYYNYTDKAFKIYSDNVQLPENPLD